MQKLIGVAFYLFVFGIITYGLVGDIIEFFKSKLEYPTKKFLRPNKPYTFANKYCIIEIKYSEGQIAYFNKITLEGYINDDKIYPFEKAVLNSIYKELCKKFNYGTKAEDVAEIIKSIIFIRYKNINLPVDYSIISLNELSVAELASLPGMNIGKANKISAYRQCYNYHNIQEFLYIAKINEEASANLRKLFDNELKCDLKQLNDK